MSAARYFQILFVVVGLIGVGTAINADIPKGINYQGRLTNDLGAPIDTVVQMMFSIYDDSLGGNVKWTETNPSVVVSGGLFEVFLGSINSIPDTVFESPNRYLGIAVGDYIEMAPRTKILSTAYSYRSLCSDSTDYVPSTVIDHGGTGGLEDDDHHQYLHVSGLRMMAGDLSLGNNKITNVSAGTDPYDAVNYQQAVKAGDPAGGALTGSYPNPILIENAVYSSHIVNNAILAEDLADNSITTDKLVGLSVTEGKIAWSAVTTDRIQDDAVTNSKIAMFAVTSLELATGSVTSEKIADGTISVVDMGSSARTAVGSVDLSGSTSSTSPATLDEFTINTPAAGVLLITVSGQFYFNLDALTSSSVTAAGYIGLCDSPANSSSCDDTWVTRYYQDADAASNTNHTEQYTIQRTFVAPGPGSYTFYLNGQATPSGATLHLWGNSKATAVFVQSTLSITSPTATNSHDEQDR